MAQAIGASREAQQRWASVSLRHRLAVIKRLRHRIASAGLKLASEIDRPDRRSAESLVCEVLPLADACRFLEDEAQRILRPVRWGRRSRPLWLMSTRLEVHREPMGVVLIIGPGNYPLLLPGIQIVQALAAGNAVLLKPAPGCCEPMVHLRRLLLAAGLDPALLQILPEDIDTVQQAIDAGVDRVVLTGSVDTGRRVLSKLNAQLIPSIMELSGCDAVFICPDADLELAARSLVFGMTLNGGATCIAPRRVFVPASMKNELEKRLVELLADSQAADVNPAMVAQLSRLLAGAIAAGARIIAGGQDSIGRIRPVVVADALPNMPLLQEDVFAPIVSILNVESEQQALEWNSACPYALAATVFGREPNAYALARKINAGVVVVNDIVVPHADPRLPFAPRGWSGFGVTRGAEGLLEMTRLKAISVRGGRIRPHLDAPRRDDERLFSSYLQAVHGKSLRERIRHAARVVRELVRRSVSSGASR